MKTTVHITKLAQWRSVLTTWFEQGADWFNPVEAGGFDKLMPQYFTKDEARYLHLDDDNTISWSTNYLGGEGEAISYKRFYEMQQTKPALWLSRAQDKQNNRLTLRKTSSGMVHTINYTKENQEAIKHDSAYHLTQPEIEKWGFSPDKFTREAVEELSIWVSEPDARGKEHVLLKAGAVVTNKEYSADLMHDYTTEAIYHLTESDVRQSIYNTDKFTPVTIESDTSTQTYKLSDWAEDLISGEELFSIKADTEEQASILKNLLNVSNSYMPSRDRYLLVYGTAARSFTKYNHTKAFLDFDEAVEKV